MDDDQIDTNDFNISDDESMLPIVSSSTKNVSITKFQYFDSNSMRSFFHREYNHHDSVEFIVAKSCNLRTLPPEVTKDMDQDEILMFLSICTMVFQLSFGMVEQLTNVTQQILQCQLNQIRSSVKKPNLPYTIHDPKLNRPYDLTIIPPTTIQEIRTQIMHNSKGGLSYFNSLPIPTLKVEKIIHLFTSMMF